MLPNTKSSARFLSRASCARSPSRRMKNASSPKWTRSEERRVGKSEGLGRRVGEAEDGIRDDLVTGVQTCALPIWPHNTVCSVDGQRMYLAPMGNPKKVSIVDVAKHKIIGEIPFTSVVRPVAVTKDEKRFFAEVDEIGRASCREK